MSRTAKGTIVTILGGIFWGLSGNCGQFMFTQKGLNAWWLVSVRLIMSGSLMLLFMLSRRDLRQNLKALLADKSNYVMLLLFSILGMMSCQLSYYVTIEASNACTAIVLQYTSPILIMLYLALKNRKMPKKIEFLALGMVVAGTFFLATHGDFHGLAISKKALVWGLISSLTVVFYNLMPIKMMNKYGTIAVLGMGMFIGGLCLSFYTKPWIVPGVWDIQTVGAIGFLILFGTVFAFSAYLYGVRLIGASKASMYAAAEPLTSTIVGALFMGVNMVFMDVVGLILVLVGVGVVSTVKNK